MFRSASPASAAALQRRRPLLSVSAAVALLVVCWAAADRVDAAEGPGDAAATAHTAPAPRIPRQAAAHRALNPHPAQAGGAARALFAPAVPGDDLRPATVPHPARSAGADGTVVGASLSATTAIAPAAPGAATAQEPGRAVKELPITLDKGSRAALSVAALDLTDGRRVGYGTSGEPVFDTASIVKVDVLATVLLKAQDAGHGLTATQRDLAADMIKASDNKATDRLWNDIGGTAGLTRANHRLGLSHTTAGAGGLWGLTQTTAHDQLSLLSAVYGAGRSPLSAASRAYARSLMAHVEEDQRWGVSAGGKAVGLKNGWLPRSATGKWDINSIGLVSAGGHQVLLATLSSGNTGMDAGVGLVEKGARAAVAALGLHDAA